MSGCTNANYTSSSTSFGLSTTFTPHPKIGTTEITLQGPRMVTRAGHQQRHRWVGRGTHYGLICSPPTGQTGGHWEGGGALSHSSQVELERDVELER